MEQEKVYQITKPHPRLMKLYTIHSLLSGPAIFLTYPLLYFRYHTMEYRFDDEGVHMKWGILFRREVNLTYARIQDIHLTSGIIQRWLGLADIQIQTASGSATAEMKIEGILEYEALRDFLYRKMRGLQDRGAGHAAGNRPVATAEPAFNPEALGLLREIHQELQATRAALEQSGRRGQSGS